MRAIEEVQSWSFSRLRANARNMGDATSDTRGGATKTLMIQGTTSDAGKSLLVTALCRWLSRRGVRVAPFKPQNMALNSAVTPEGGEIGRAQAVQAQACRIPPHVDMNPVLLKPNSDTGAQIIIQGKAVHDLSAVAYHEYKTTAMKAVLDSYARLSAAYECVVVEGAGSPAEINLRDRDIANMGFAEEVDCPVLIVADIDRGGVFAHLVGTLELLSESEQARVKGFVINRFRGDLALLTPGLTWLEERTKKPVIGVLPYLYNLEIEAEDALPEAKAQKTTGVLPAKGRLRVVVPALPRISNHTDLDPLRLHPQVDLIVVAPGQKPPASDLIILPGTKSVRADLSWLKAEGWGEALNRHLRYRGKLIGLCGGYQMLGAFVHDPHGIEGAPGSSEGLGLLAIETTLEPEKVLRKVRGRLSPLVDQGNKAVVIGYEIHAGVTTGAATERPALQLETGSNSVVEPDGSLSDDGQILGSYVHGLFDAANACAALLRWAGLDGAAGVDMSAAREATFERLADAVEEHLDTQKLASLLGIS